MSAGRCLLFLGSSERPGSARAHGAHAHGSQRQGIALCGRACGENGRAPLAPPGCPDHHKTVCGPGHLPRQRRALEQRPGAGGQPKAWV